MQERVVIVGGGLAGLAAAVGLAARGCRVTVVEARPRWGGRASSFVDQTTGETIDNCQHVALGCCTNFLHFCRLMQIDSLLQRESQLWFIGPDGRSSDFAASSWLPAPLHLFPAFLRLKYLSTYEKWRLAWGLRALARVDPAKCGTEPFSAWLKRHQQPPTLIERFWHVVLVSALSETLDRIDISHARKVFVDAFLRSHSGWEVWIPRGALHDLYGDQLSKSLVSMGVDLRLRAGVQQLTVADGRVRGVTLRDGQPIEADHVVLAVPHHLAVPLLPANLKDDAGLRRIEQLEDAPISSVHLWFDRVVLPVPHATLVSRVSQWVFARPASAADAKATSGGQYLQVVISASREVDGRPQAEVIQQVVEELAAIWPAVGEATLRHSRIVTEHRAALSVMPGVEALRPPQQTAIPNLQLAGDWTRTGWPSTMEGAVRSGFLAAENILRHCGRPESIVVADLATSWLSKLAFGL